MFRAKCVPVNAMKHLTSIATKTLNQKRTDKTAFVFQMCLNLNFIFASFFRYQRAFYYGISLKGVTNSDIETRVPSLQ